MAEEETFEITAEGAAALGSLFTRAFNPRETEPDIDPVRGPDEEWELSGGTAWVFRVPGNETVTKPVIIADGFSGGASTLNDWKGLWEGSLVKPPVYPWGTRLHERGRDVIVLGYDSRCAPILTNAEVAIECIQKANHDKTDDAPLVVGGLSMGGLVTRYALAKMEKDEKENGGPDHETAVYFSYDSPHRGGWIPISLQVFAHFLKGLADVPGNPMPEPEKEQMRALSNLMNSPASRELAWMHTDTHLSLDSTFTEDAKRRDFLRDLDDVGSFATGPYKVGVANGRGDGGPLEVEPGKPVEAGEKNLEWPKTPQKPGAALYTQDDGTDKLVANLIRLGLYGPIEVKTSGIPALDGAPGGTLDSFAIAAAALQKAGFAATVTYPDVCFVPVASAVDLADPSAPYEPVNGMDKGDSGLNDFKVASNNEAHTLLTEELCDWLSAQFDEERP
jgi:hypothetical protein